jgi:hypothetical protein
MNRDPRPLAASAESKEIQEGEAPPPVPLLPRTQGRASLTEGHLRPIAAEPDWKRQRQMWIEVHRHGWVHFVGGAP